MSARIRHNVNELGPSGAQPMVFAHGFGCDQHMWRHVAPRFADRYRVVLFDHLGAGGADHGAPAEELADRIAAAAVDFQHAHTRDDIAVVILQASSVPG